MLYTLIPDLKKYLEPVIDAEQVDELVGDDYDLRIDFNGAPRSYKGIINEPLNVSFPTGMSEQKGCVIPDIAVFQGRLFLSKTACDILKPVLEKDGEFLPAVYEKGEGFIYTPLNVAEDVDGLDTALSKKNDWGYFSHLAFHEEKVANWSVFRIRGDSFMSLFCQEPVKALIENAQLTGVYITPDLSNIFPQEQGNVSGLN